MLRKQEGLEEKAWWDIQQQAEEIGKMKENEKLNEKQILDYKERIDKVLWKSNMTFQAVLEKVEEYDELYGGVNKKNTRPWEWRASVYWISIVDKPKSCKHFWGEQYWQSFAETRCDN